MVRPLPVGCRAIALAVLVFPMAALADFKRDYGTGLKALQDGDLERAISEFQKAIEENPESAERVRIYGMRFEPYMPHYYLGEALFKSGDCAGALRAWDEAARRGVVQSQSLMATLEASRSQCQGAMLDPDQLLAAKSAVDELADGVTRMSQLKREMGRDWASAWESGLGAAQQRLGEYRSGLQRAESDGDADAVGRIASSARGEATTLQSLWSEASQRQAALNRQREQQQIAQARNSARVELVQAVAAVRSEIASPVADATLESLARELGQLAERGNGIADSAPVREYQSLTRDLTSKLRQYRQGVQEFRARQQEVARRTPPAPLRQVAEAYFAGRYDDVNRLVNPTNFSDERARIQALLFRAAARFNTYTLGGESEQTLLRQAQSDIRTIKQISGDFSPYLAAFSPKFMNLYETTL